MLAIAAVGGCGANSSGRAQSERTLATGGYLAKARQLFFAAVDGDARSLRACDDLLQRCDEDPAKVAAYQGGCRLLQAARAPLPWDKGRLVKEGLALLDDAVRRAPGDLEVRFVRGMSSYHLPRFMGRAATAASDLAAVAAEAENATVTGELDLPIACAALFHHGKVLDDRGDRAGAVAAWRRATRLGPDTRAGQAAARAAGPTAAGRAVETNAVGVCITARTSVDNPRPGPRR
jgi:hypothetical protein